MAEAAASSQPPEAAALSPPSDGHSAEAVEPENADTANHFSVFVGDLSEGVDKKALREAFGVYGRMSDVKVMLDSRTFKSMGYGFVSYLHQEDAEMAIKGMHGQLLGRRRVRVNWATRKPPPPRQPVRHRSYDAATMSFDDVIQATSQTNTTLFVGGINEFITEDDVREAFEPFGTVSKVVLNWTDHLFVEFEDKTSAAHAIMNLNGTSLRGRDLRVFWGVERAPDNQRSGAGGGPGADSGYFMTGSSFPQAGGPRATRPLSSHAHAFFPTALPGAVRGGTPRWNLGAGSMGAPRQPTPAGLAGYFIPGYATQQRATAAGAMRMGGAGSARAMSTQMLQQQRMAAMPQMHMAAAQRTQLRMAARPQTHMTAAQRTQVAGAGMKGGQFQYTQTVRNALPPMGGGGAGACAGMGQASSAIPGSGAEPLTTAMLADATTQDQKQMLGVRIFPLVQMRCPGLAGKITGMLLEMDNSELLMMLDSAELLKTKVEEAVMVLLAHKAL